MMRSSTMINVVAILSIVWVFIAYATLVVRSQSTVDSVSLTVQLSSAASLIEQAFPSNIVATSTSTTAASGITISASQAGAASTVNTIRGVIQTIAAGIITESAAAYTATNTAFSSEYIFSATTSGAKVKFFSGAYDFAVVTLAPTVADYELMPTLAYYPLQANGIVPLYNLPLSVTSGQTLALTGSILCRIHRGNITVWNDPSIIAANPNMNWLDPSIVGRPINVLLTSTGSSVHLAMSTYCTKVDTAGFAAAGIKASTNPAYTVTASYFGNSDLICNAVGDRVFSLAMSALSNAKSISIDIASMINSAGTVLTASTDSISLNIFEQATSGYAAGTNAFDLTAPSTLAAWPIVTMTYLYIDSYNTLTTCENKRTLISFLLWFYSSPVVAAIAASQSLVVFPSLFVTQLSITTRIRSEVTCRSVALVASNTAVGFLSINPLAANLVSLYSNFYISIDSTRTYSISSLLESQAIHTLMAGEFDFLLVNSWSLSAVDLNLMVGAGATMIPAFLVGISPIFNLPTSIQTLYATPTAASAHFPALYPLYLTLDVLTYMFIGSITSWLDPMLVKINPQLTQWFAATGASTNLTLVVGATKASDPLRGAHLLFQSMSVSHAASLPANAAFFPTTRWVDADASDGINNINPFAQVLAANPNTVVMIDTESRLSLKTTTVSGGVSYRLLGTGGAIVGASIITQEFQMIQTNSLGVVEIVAPTTTNLRQCSSSQLGNVGTTMTTASLGASIDTMDAGTVANQISYMQSVITQQNWVSAASPVPSCWPLTGLLSFVVPLTYSSTAAAAATNSVTSQSFILPTCASGLHALEFVHYTMSTAILTAPAESLGIIRLAESSVVRRMSEQILYTATCDGSAMLVILPLYYTVPSAVTSFGVAVSTIGLIALAVSVGVVIYFRNEVVIRSSSAPFLLLILLGLSMLLSSAIAWSQTAPSKASCGCFGWFLNLGLTLLFVPLFLKTWRVWRIFSGAHLRVIKLSNHKLLMMTAIAIASEIAFLSIFQGVSPVTAIQFATNINGRMNFYQHCAVSNSTGMAFVAIEGAYKAGMLIFGAIMAFSTRNVKGTFNEASSIAWSIYNTLLAGIITIVIIVFIAAIETTLIILVQIFLLWLVFISWGLLFLPKFHSLAQSEEANLVASRSDLPQEVSNGFSFASAVNMSQIQLKQYYFALKIQVSKVEERLNVVLTKFAMYAGGVGPTTPVVTVALKVTSKNNSKNNSGGSGGGHGNVGAAFVGLPLSAQDRDRMAEKAISGSGGDERLDGKSNRADRHSRAMSTPPTPAHAATPATPTVKDANRPSIRVSALPAASRSSVVNHHPTAAPTTLGPIITVNKTLTAHRPQPVIVSPVMAPLSLDIASPSMLAKPRTMATLLLSPFDVSLTLAATPTGGGDTMLLPGAVVATPNSGISDIATSSTSSLSTSTTPLSPPSMTHRALITRDDADNNNKASADTEPLLGAADNAANDSDNIEKINSDDQPILPIFDDDNDINSILSPRRPPNAANGVHPIGVASPPPAAPLLPSTLRGSIVMRSTSFAGSSSASGGAGAVTNGASFTSPKASTQSTSTNGRVTSATSKRTSASVTARNMGVGPKYAQPTAASS